MSKKLSEMFESLESRRLLSTNLAIDSFELDSAETPVTTSGSVPSFVMAITVDNPDGRTGAVDVSVENWDRLGLDRVIGSGSYELQPAGEGKSLLSVPLASDFNQFVRFGLHAISVTVDGESKANDPAGYLDPANYTVNEAGNPVYAKPGNSGAGFTAEIVAPPSWEPWTSDNNPVVLSSSTRNVPDPDKGGAPADNRGTAFAHLVGRNGGNAGYTDLAVMSLPAGKLQVFLSKDGVLSKNDVRIGTVEDGVSTIKGGHALPAGTYHIITAPSKKAIDEAIIDASPSFTLAKRTKRIDVANVASQAFSQRRIRDFVAVRVQGSKEIVFMKSSEVIPSDDLVAFG